MSFKFKLSLFIILISLITSVSADQAAYISESDAIRAQNLLQGSRHVKFFCALCGDTNPQLVQVDDIKVVDVNYENLREIQINNEGIDLAYTYYFSSGRWRNLAMSLDIPVDSVDEYIE
jgi:hypothetical protein